MDSGEQYRQIWQDRWDVDEQPWEAGILHHDFQCVYITEGTGWFSYKGEKYRIVPGTIITLAPGIRYWYEPDDTVNWTEYLVGFKGEYPEDLQRLGYFSDDQVIKDVGMHESFVAIFTELLEISKEQRSGYQHVLGSDIMVLLAKINYLLQQDLQLHEHELELIEHAKVKFQEHLYTTLDIESLASSLNVSYTTFRDIFKKYADLSPYQYFLQMKLNKAKELLSEGNLTVKEVSFKLAFDNPYYFSRFFKKKTGVSPSRWNGKEIETNLDFLE
ncbi:AraC family transcriptional regulator [Sphaerochaeta sp.]|uniref:AraC family transcriptional regulator n=1 Tax=Sphaerochaeta sp. TaxID=1972642 RepID=UPI003D115AEC